MKIGRHIHLAIAIILAFSQAVSAEKIVRILSLDGGGMRGIIELVILREIEFRLNKPISQIFDMVAGTSVGGIIALGLVAPDSQGNPRYSADNLLNVLSDFGPEVFNASVCHKIETLGGLIGPKYQTEGMARIADIFLGDSLMSQALIPTLVTSYDIEGESDVKFSSHFAQTFPHDLDCLMREVAQATAAAPSYFPLAKVKFKWGVLENIADGAIYKMNPALPAYLEAKKIYPDHTVEIYAIGSGKLNETAQVARLKSGGLFQWMAPIIHHFQNSDIEADNDTLHGILNEDGHKHYYRLNIPLYDYHRTMDDTSKEHIQYLYNKGIEATKTPLFNQLIARLAEEVP